jgi:UDP-N-acetylglucosamine 2-epimerase (non-hydrolysing)
MAAAIGGAAGTAVVHKGGAKRSPLCIAASRAAVVRLTPVVSALSAAGLRPAVAGLMDELGQHAPRTLECFRRSAGEIVADVEAALERRPPGIALIAGDSDAAVACAVAAARHDVPIARLGAGLRCGDRQAPDEINRIVLDAMAERLYADSEEAVATLLEEGVSPDRIRRVGSTLPDVVFRWTEHARGRALWRRLGLAPRAYALVTLQRRENLNDPVRLTRIVDALCALAGRMPVVACLDPHVRAELEPAGHLQRLAALGATFVGPLGYVDFLSLQTAAGAVITDSSGVQEETTILGVRCFTLRRSTERVLTLTQGTNLLLGDEPEDLAYVTPGEVRESAEIDITGWDGAAGRRISADLRMVTAA